MATCSTLLQFAVFFVIQVSNKISWTLTTCLANQWSCLTIGGCIAKTQVMDGVIDCLDYSDENACYTNSHNCTYRSQCNSHTGTTAWSCSTCPNGQIGDGITCVADPCIQTPNCPSHSFCYSAFVSHTPDNITTTIQPTKSCVCDEGYYYNLTLATCVKGKCGLGLATCEPGAICYDQNYFESYCKCKPGYPLINNVCQDPCTLNTDTCDSKATCTATSSTSYTCACNTGYKGNGQYCYVDLNSMFPGPNCLTSPKFFECIDGSCVDITLMRDTYNDCSQGEDEACDAEANLIRCDTNLCVDPSDVTTYCLKGELYDKLYCEYFNMTPSYMCSDYTKCIPWAWVNDGVCNCLACDDEQVTSTTTSTTTTATTIPTTTTTLSSTSTTTVPTTTTSTIATTTTVPSTTTTVSSTTTPSTSTTTSTKATTTLAASTSSAETTTTVMETTTIPPTWVNPFDGAYGACWKDKVSQVASAPAADNPLCQCYGNRQGASGGGNCGFDNSSFLLEIRSKDFCNQSIAWTDKFADSSTTAFSDMARLVAYYLRNELLPNTTMNKTIKSVCVQKNGMRKGSVLTNVLVQVDPNSGIKPDAAAKVLTDGMAGLAGSIGSGIAASEIRDIDECGTDTLNECSSYSTCSNTFGSYSCTCKSGYLDKSIPNGRQGTICRKDCGSGWNIGDDTCFPVWLLVLLILLALLLLLCCLIGCCCWICSRKKSDKDNEYDAHEESAQTEVDVENGIYPPTDRVLTAKHRPEENENGERPMTGTEEERPLTQADNARSGPIEDQPFSPPPEIPGRVPHEQEEELYNEPVVIPPTPEPATRQRKKKRNDVNPDEEDNKNKSKKRVNQNDESSDRGQKAGNGRRGNKNDGGDEYNDDSANKRQRDGRGRKSNRNDDDYNDEDRQRSDKNRGRSRSRNPPNDDDRDRDRSRDRRGRSKSRNPDDQDSQNGKRSKSRTRENENGGEDGNNADKNSKNKSQGDDGGQGNKSPRKKAINSSAKSGGPPPLWQPWSAKPGGFGDDSTLLDV